MDKVNEAIEVGEQETPFHLLAHEEQQRIIDANQKRVREAPTLHEWNIRVRNPHAWLIISIPIGIFILIGAWLGKVRISTLCAKTKKFSHLISII
ncbi:hypothetical protein [Aeromonas caviae]|uniref:hypothetical protein n=1 Tax=Aeromonas caviae TaxID=648 RepID=UPI003CE8B8C5